MSLEIQLVDVDIEYDSETGIIKDAGSDNDEIEAVFFFADDNPIGSLPVGDEELSVSLNIPGVFGIDPAGDTVVSAPGGSLQVLAPDSILTLSLLEATVVYNPLNVGNVVFEFIFAGASGTIDSQDLPLSLIIADPVTVTLSAQASEMVVTNDEVRSFKASGTGELLAEFDLDPDNEIPEPTAVALVTVTAGLLAGARRRG